MKTVILSCCVAAFILVGGALTRAQTQTTEKASVIAAVAPLFPAIARAAHVKGDVVIDATLDTDGSVRATKAVSGNPLLQKACEKAATKWKFSASPDRERHMHLTFSFAVIDGGKSDPEYTITFMPPYKIEVLWNPPPPGY